MLEYRTIKQWGQREEHLCWGDYSLGVSGDGIRVQTAVPDDYKIWWIKLDSAGRIIAHGTDWSTTPPDDVLADVERQGPAIAAAVAPLRVDGDYYIRFGNLPRGGRSRNHADGTQERGVSCYEARKSLGGWRLAGDGLPAAAIQAAFGCYGNVTLLLTGERAGIGSDGEPVVRHPQIVAHLQWGGSEYVES